MIFNKKFQDNSGMVLVMVLIMLMAVIMIGATVMRSATLETRIAGNDLCHKEDFYAAESAVNLAILESTTWIRYSTGINLTEGKTYTINDPRNGSDRTPSVEVKLSREGLPPVGTGWSVKTLKAYYFDINTDCNGAKIQSGVWKAFPR